MTPYEVVDYLTLRNYIHNRRISPSVTVERWEKVYGPSVWGMEKEYQKELLEEPRMDYQEHEDRSKSSVTYTIEGADLKPVIDRVRELLYDYHPAGYGTLAELGWCSAVKGSHWRAVVKRAASCE